MSIGSSIRRRWCGGTGEIFDRLSVIGSEGGTSQKAVAAAVGTSEVLDCRSCFGIDGPGPGRSAGTLWNTRFLLFLFGRLLLPGFWGARTVSRLCSVRSPRSALGTGPVSGRCIWFSFGTAAAAPVYGREPQRYSHKWCLVVPGGPVYRFSFGCGSVRILGCSGIATSGRPYNFVTFVLGVVEVSELLTAYEDFLKTEKQASTNTAPICGTSTSLPQS